MNSDQHASSQYSVIVCVLCVSLSVYVPVCVEGIKSGPRMFQDKRSPTNQRNVCTRAAEAI